MFKFLHIDDQDMVKSNLAWPKLNGKKIKMVSGHSIMQCIATVTESLMNLHKVLFNSGLPLICCHAHCHCYWDYDPRHHHYSQFLHYSRCSQDHYLFVVCICESPQWQGVMKMT